jgi:WD40 repeat protein
LKTGKAYDWPAIVGVFDGHTGSVNSVAFSRDGWRIVSDSDDNTIRVWDAETRDIVGPLRGHTNWVSSVAFSQDGIVSGSRDETIRVWDAETGELVEGPLQGYTDSVMSVAFSQDGRRIVPGSDDETIHVWDAETGDAVAGPLQGHTGSVRSVALFLALVTRQSVFGMLEMSLQVRYGDALIGSTPSHSRRTVGTLILDLMIRQSASGIRTLFLALVMMDSSKIARD